MEKICVLMTCYNPKDYILEQIESILLQKDVIVDLVIRDDFSKDTKWLDQIPSDSRVTVLRGDRNLGVAQNIMALVRYAKENRSDYTYYAYSDQDDVWKDDKLITGIRALKNMDLSKPCLYYSNLTVVNENLQGTELLFTTGVVKNTLAQGLAQIFAFACTFVFNNKMLDALLDMPIEFMGFDHLAYYLALVKGEACFDEVSHILYRQTGENVSGDKSKGLKRIIMRAKNFNKPHEDLARAGGGSFGQVADYLLRNFQGELSVHDVHLLTKVANYRESFGNKLRLIFDKEVRAGYQPKDFYRWLRIILNRY